MSDKSGSKVESGSKVIVTVNGEKIEISDAVLKSESTRYQRGAFRASEHPVALAARVNARKLAIRSTLDRLEIAGTDKVLDAKISNKYKGLLREASYLADRPALQGVQGDVATLRSKTPEQRTAAAVTTAAATVSEATSTSAKN